MEAMDPHAASRRGGAGASLNESLAVSVCSVFNPSQFPVAPVRRGGGSSSGGPEGEALHCGTRRHAPLPATCPLPARYRVPPLCAPPPPLSRMRLFGAREPACAC